jgi:hypothetical protein
LVAISQQKIEDPEAALPVFGFRVLQIGINDFEGARKRDAQSTRYGWKPRLRGIAVCEIQWRPRR